MTTERALSHKLIQSAVQKDAQEAAAMELVGRDSKQMSAHYTHFGREALERATAALPEVLTNQY